MVFKKVDVVLKRFFVSVVTSLTKQLYRCQGIFGIFKHVNPIRLDDAR